MWRTKERMWYLLAWVYQTFSAFFIMCLVTMADDPGFYKFCRAWGLGLTFAFIVKPGMQVVNQYTVLMSAGAPGGAELRSVNN